MSTLEKAVIIDIDGTLMDNSTYKHMYFVKDPDWNKIDERTLEPNKWCLDLTVAMCNAGYKILFVTARSEDARGVTLQWLMRILPASMTSHYLKDQWELIMRPADDRREGSVVKFDIYNRLIMGKYDVSFAVDDMKSNIDMWRVVGIAALHCDDFYL